MTEVRYGDGAILDLPRLVAGLLGESGVRAGRVLLVCGARSFEASGAARMLPELEQVAQVRRWSDFAPNTDAADLARGLAVAARFRPELILGIGGGSALDMAKLLAGYGPGTDPATVAALIRAGGKVTDREPRLVLAPTTSGSGSEATHFAVVYLGEEKFSVAGDALRPDAVILDPELSLSGSAYQRATSGIDAVAQAVESLWAVGATERSRGWARHALRLLLPAIESYVNQPDPRAARAMAIGSHLAGRAIDISKTTAAHALSYAITKRFEVSHGHAVALTLGGFIQAHATATDRQLRQGLDPTGHRRAMAEVLLRLGATDGTDARLRFGKLMDRLGLAPLSQVWGSPTPEERRGLVRRVNAERLGNNPVRFDEEELVAIIGQAS